MNPRSEKHCSAKKSAKTSKSKPLPTQPPIKWPRSANLVISYTDFEKVDIRVGQIVDVQDFPEARKPAYKLTIDFGPELGVKKSSAQITVHYTKENLKGRKVLAVVNFAPKQIGPFISEVLTLGTADKNGDVLLVDPGRGADPGSRLF